MRGVGDLDGVDNNRFLDLARQEGLSALLFRILEEDSLIHKFPATIQKSLKESYLLSLSHNIVLMNDLVKILLSLEEKGVRTIVLKGAALLERVYSDIGVRPVMDIDLLFCEENEEVKKVLEGLGYRLISTCPRIYDNGRTVLDIHTDIDSFTRFGPLPYAPNLNISSLWENGSPWSESFKSVRILSPEDAILTLSIHLMKHSFLRLIWLIDIIEVMKKNPGIDWNMIGQRTRESGFEKVLFYVLSYLKEVLGMVPDDFLTEIKPERLGLIEQGIMKRIIKNHRVEGYGDILYLYMIRGAFRRILFGMRILFPAKEKIVEISGAKYSYLYYPKRVFELFIMAIMVLWSYISDIRQSAVGSLGGNRL